MNTIWKASREYRLRAPRRGGRRGGDRWVSPEAGFQFGSVRRGYDPAQVDEFLTQLASAIQILEARIRDAREAPEDTPQGVDERLAARFAGILAIQQDEAEKLLAEAQREAEAMVAAATQEAEGIRADEQDAAERSIQDAAAFKRQAAEEADRSRVELDERRRDMIAKLPAIQQRLATFLRDLQKTLDSLEGPAVGNALTSNTPSMSTRRRAIPRPTTTPRSWADAAVAAGLDLSSRGSRTRGIARSVVLGGGFFLLTDAWIGFCVPIAVLLLVAGGFSRETEPPSR